MDKDQLIEFGILANTLIVLTLQSGGEMTISRDEWENISSYTVLREYDEETNTDTFKLIGKNKDRLL